MLLFIEYFLSFCVNVLDFKVDVFSTEMKSPIKIKV